MFVAPGLCFLSSSFCPGGYESLCFWLIVLHIQDIGASASVEVLLLTLLSLPFLCFWAIICTGVGFYIVPELYMNYS